MALGGMPRQRGRDEHSKTSAEPDPPRPRQLDDQGLLAAYEQYMRAGRCSPVTVTDRLELLRRVAADVPAGLIAAGTEDLAQWLARGGWAAWTHCTYFSHIRAFFRWAIELDHLQVDPSLRLARPQHPARLPNPCTDAELIQALRGADERWRLILSLAAYAGLRASEITRIRREHITQATLRVVNGKGGKTAAVPTSPHIWELIDHRREGLLVTSASGAPIRCDLSALARPFFDRLGLPGLHLHRLRHWAITQVYRSTRDLLVTQRFARHSSPVTTMGYALLEDAAVRDAVNALPRMA